MPFPDYQELAQTTGLVDMRKDTKVKPRVEGGFKLYDSNKDIELRFVSIVPFG